MGRNAIVITLLLTAVVSVQAQAAAEEKSCIAVTVNGQHQLPYDCLTQQLTPPAVAQNANAAKGLNTLSARQASQPGNKLGLYNHAATAVRMGANFGHSAQAQRPGAAPVASPLLPAR